jgi:glucosamine--fructose-6-phosphate aminotransferase (isomerizing)
MEPMSPDVLIRQAESLPALTREATASFDAAVQNAFDPGELAGVNRVYLTGDGDSYHAAEAAALAFEELAGVTCEPISAQRFLDYGADFIPIYSPTSTLVAGISASGRTERGLQALERAGERGALTVAVTGQAGSPFTQSARRAIVVEIEDYGPSPGIRTYHANLAALLLLAVRLGVAKKRLSPAEADAHVEEIAGLATVMTATIEACRETAASLVSAWKDADRMIFVGSGPSYGTALFAAAKVVEAAGVFAIGQDLEEWSHVERYAHPQDLPDMPMVVIAPPGRSAWRAAPLAELAKKLGRRVAVIAMEGDDSITRHADFFFPVKGEVREAFSPLVYHLVFNHFASYLTTALGRLCFRTDRPRR